MYINLYQNSINTLWINNCCEYYMRGNYLMYAISRCMKWDQMRYQGYITKATLPRLHYQGYITKATLPRLHHQGYITKATLPRLHYQGYITKATIPMLHYQGYITKATLPRLHYQGYITKATLPFYKHFNLFTKLLRFSITNGLVIHTCGITHRCWSEYKGWNPLYKLSSTALNVALQRLITY